MGRIYRESTPATRGELEPATPATPGVAPVAQASAQAGDPPSKEVVRAAKKADAAAPLVEQPDSIEEASKAAGDPPVESTNPPARNASREEWVAYARQHGEKGKLDGLTRNAIRDRYL